MHLHLNSEDQALLKAVELAVAEKGQDGAGGQAASAKPGSIEEMCFALAGSAPEAAGGFRDDLLARLQAALIVGDAETGVVGAEADVRSEIAEIAEVADARVAPIPWSENGRAERRVVNRRYEERGASRFEWIRQTGMLFAAAAAVMVFGCAVVAMMGSRVNQTFSRISSGLKPGNDGIVAAAPTATTGAVAEATVTTGGALYSGFLNVTPVAAAAVVQKMQRVFNLSAQTYGTPLWSPDGKRLASSLGGQISVWNMETGSLAYSASMQQGRFGTTLAWSPDGARLAASVGDKVDLYATSSGTLERILSAPDMKVVPTPVAEDRTVTITTLPKPSLAWSPDGRYLASTYNDDFPTFGEMMAGIGMLDPNLPEAERVVTSSVHVWDAATGDLAYTLALSKPEILDLLNLTAQGSGGWEHDALMKVGWSPNGKYLATLYFNRVIVVWDVASRTRIRTLYDPANFWENQGLGLTEFQWMPDGHTIAQYQHDFVQLWDVETGATRSMPDIPPGQGIPPAMFTADPALPHTPVPTYAYRAEGYSAIGAAGFTQQGDKLITMDGQLRLWDVAAGKQVYKQTVANDRANFLLRWAPDGKVAMYSGNWQELRFWDAETKSNIRVLSTPPEMFLDAEWSPDGSKLVLVTDKGVEVWGDPADFPLYVAPTATPLARAVCGTWAMANAPPLADGAGLADVSVAGSSDVWAVGYARPTVGSGRGATNSGISSSLALHWDGEKWARVDVPRVGDGGNQLNGVAALASDDVWAVGTSGDFEGLGVGFLGARNVGAFVLHWNGTAWAQVEIPDVGRDGSARLLGVRGTAKDDIWAVGYTGGDFAKATATPVGGGPEDVLVPSLPLVLHWDGARWSVVDAPAPGTVRSQLSALSVVDKDEVWAVGIKTSQQPRQLGGVTAEPFAVRWDGARWAEVATPEFGNIMGGVSIRAEQGWIVGSLGSEGDSNARMARWDGNKWTQSNLAALSNDGTGGLSQDSLEGVLYTGLDDGWAVGTTNLDDRSNRTDGLVMHWDGWQWSPMALPDDVKSSDEWSGNVLSAVSAGPDGDLWAVGRRSGIGPEEAIIIMRLDRSGCGGG